MERTLTSPRAAPRPRPRAARLPYRHGDPTTDAYGCIIRGRGRAATREGLEGLFATSPRVDAIERVWTPETAGPVDPSTVPWIVEAHARQLRRGTSLRVATVLLALVAALASVALVGRHPELEGLVLSLFLLAGPAVFDAGRGLFRLANPIVASRNLLAAPKLGRALRHWTHRRFRRASRAAALAWTVVWVVGLALHGGGAVERIGLAKTGPAAGELWRWATCTVAHAGPLHLVFNAIAMIVLGAATERLAGRAAFGLVFMTAALAGSAASVAFLPGGISVGASGGIVGLMGFLVVHGVRFRDRLPTGFARLLAADLAWLGGTSLVFLRTFDHAGHAGGFVAGALLALVVPPRRAGTPPPRWIAVGGTLAWGAMAATVVGALGVLVLG